MPNQEYTRQVELEAQARIRARHEAKRAAAGLPPKNIQPPAVTTKAVVDWTACVHRGEQTRTVGCATCGGAVAIKVFACSEFGECTIAKKIGNLAVCQGCASYSA